MPTLGSYFMASVGDLDALSYTETPSVSLQERRKTLGGSNASPLKIIRGQSKVKTENSEMETRHILSALGVITSHPCLKPSSEADLLRREDV